MSRKFRTHAFISHCASSPLKTIEALGAAYVYYNAIPGIKLMTMQC